jgi:hypothetical protein
MLVQGPALLHPERPVFDAISARVAGAAAQLAETTVVWQERIVRRFAKFTDTQAPSYIWPR